MSAADARRTLLDRVAGRLQALEPGADQRTREVRMFGAVAVMLDDAMLVAAHRDGGMLVRVDPAEDAELGARPGASRAQMGTGRSMGEGWLRIDPAALRSSAALELWLSAALRRHVRAR